MLTETEGKVLSIVFEKGLVRQTELKDILNGSNAVDAAKALVAKGFVMPVSPLGEVAYTVTKEGSRYLKENL